MFKHGRFGRFLGLLLLFALAAVVHSGCRSSVENGGKGTPAVPARSIDAVLLDHTNELMAIQGVVGVYQGETDAGKPCITVMVIEDTHELAEKIPGPSTDADHHGSPPCLCAIGHSATARKVSAPESTLAGWLACWLIDFLGHRQRRAGAVRVSLRRWRYFLTSSTAEPCFSAFQFFISYE